MQKGFATLEIIFATLIIAILATCAVPNAARILDRATLDYETKKFYTDMRAVQSFDRMTWMEEEYPFGSTDRDSTINFHIEDEVYTIMKISPPEKFYQTYYLPRGFYFSEYSSPVLPSGSHLSEPSSSDLSYIRFDDMGQPKAKANKALNGHIVINSRLNQATKIVFDSVGRFHGEQVK